MSRVARLIRPGTFQHVISRFVDRDWYLTSEEERSYYLLLLGHALEHTDWLCVAYCLMSNHLHFGLIAGEQPLESWTKRVNSPFANWLNKQRGRLGPIFADRPKTIEVPRERELTVVAYIHNNPVRAKLVNDASDSSWSSHRAYVGQARGPRWLAVQTELERVGFAGNPAGFDRAVRSLVDEKIEGPDLRAARLAARRHGQLEVGTPRLSEPAEVPIVCLPFGRKLPSVPTIIATVANRLAVPVESLERRYARAEISVAKHIAIQAASALGTPVATISRALNITRQRGSRMATTALTVEQRAAVSDVVALLRCEATNKG